MLLGENALGSPDASALNSLNMRCAKSVEYLKPYLPAFTSMSSSPVPWDAPCARLSGADDRGLLRTWKFTVWASGLNVARAAPDHTGMVRIAAFNQAVVEAVKASRSSDASSRLNLAVFNFIVRIVPVNPMVSSLYPVLLSLQRGPYLVHHYRKTRFGRNLTGGLAGLQSSPPTRGVRQLRASPVELFRIVRRLARWRTVLFGILG